MQPVTMRRRTKVYISGLSVICLLLVVGYFAFWRDTNVTVYDDAFEIVDYRVSVARSTTFYDGNQTLGRIKTRLKSAFGLKFIDPPRTILRTGPGNLVLFVRYKGDLPFGEVGGLVAVLRNDEDFFEQMQGKNKYDGDRQTFTGCFIMSKVPQNDDSLRVDFYLSSEHEKPMATLRVGQLN